MLADSFGVWVSLRSSHWYFEYSIVIDLKLGMDMRYLNYSNVVFLYNVPESFLLAEDLNYNKSGTRQLSHFQTCLSYDVTSKVMVTQLLRDDL